MVSPVMALRLVALNLCLTGATVSAQPGATIDVPDADGSQSLQGTWAGTGSYGQPDPKSGVTVTITGHRLRYQGAKTNDWYEASFILPKGTIPAQLHALITDSPDKGAIRRQVFAVFKLEADWLTLAEVEAGAIESRGIDSEDEPNNIAFTNEGAGVEIQDAVMRFFFMSSAD
jgi:hypothetical protein